MSKAPSSPYLCLVLYYSSNSSPLSFDPPHSVSLISEGTSFLVVHRWIDNSRLPDWFLKKLPIGSSSRKENDFVGCPRWKIAGIVSDMSMGRWEKRRPRCRFPEAFGHVLYTRIWYCFLRQKYRGKCEKGASQTSLLVVSRVCVCVCVCVCGNPLRQRPRNIFRQTFNWHAFSLSQ